RPRSRLGRALLPAGGARRARGRGVLAHRTIGAADGGAGRRADGGRGGRAGPLAGDGGGGLGLLGVPLDGASPTAETLEERVALIGGTSTCHMAASRAPKFIHGVWGPYWSAMVPGLWLMVGGPSAT